MIAVTDLSAKIGDYQRPYLTVFRIEKTPDDVAKEPVDNPTVEDLKLEANTNAINDARATLQKLLKEMNDAFLKSDSHKYKSNSESFDSAMHHNL